MPFFLKILLCLEYKMTLEEMTGNSEARMFFCVMGSVRVLILRAQLCYIIKFKVTQLPTGLL